MDSPRAYGYRPKVILGPPGCGKTHTQVETVAEAIEGGLAPERVAFVAFTQAAAQVAKDRLGERLGLDQKRLPWVRTIHSGCLGLLSIDPARLLVDESWDEFAGRFGYRLTRRSRREIDESTPAGGQPIRTPDDILVFAHEWGRNRLLTVQETLSRCPVQGLSAGELMRFDERLARFKGEQDLLDFTDLLERVLAAGLRPNVDLGLVDEGHDLSPLQVAVVEQWFEPCERSVVVADDDQAIFTFQGADPGWIHELCRRTEPIVLSQSHRVPAAVHAVAQRIIRANRDRIPKEYRPAPRDGRVLYLDLDRALDLLDGCPEAFVLVRNRRFMGQIAGALVERGVPFAVEGVGARSPLEDRHLVEAVRLACRLADGAAGPFPTSSVESLLRFVPASAELFAHGAKASVEARRGEGSFTRDELVADLGCGPLLDLIDAEGPLACLLKVSRGDRDYVRALLSRYGEVPEPTTVLTTIHASKGREADLVIVVPDMSRLTFEEYVSKGQAGQEAENRVFYVAVTRAKDTLVLVQPRTRRFYTFPSARGGRG